MPQNYVHTDGLKRTQSLVAPGGDEGEFYIKEGSDDGNAGFGTGLATKIIYTADIGTRTVQDKLDDVLHVADFGALLDGSDDTVAFQKAIDQAKVLAAQDGETKTVLADGLATLTAPLRLDVQSVMLDGQGLTLAAGHTGGDFITLDGGTKDRFKQWTGGIRNLTLLGNAGLTGLNFDGTSTLQGPQRSSYTNVNIQDCGNGVRIGTATFMLSFLHTFIRGCNVGVYFDGAAKNAGERIVFVGGVLGTNNIAIYDPDGFSGDFYLFGTSLDANQQDVNINALQVEAHGCHWESVGQGWQATPYIVGPNGRGRLSILGGRLVDSTLRGNYEYVFLCTKAANASPGIVIRDAFVNGLKARAGAWVDPASTGQVITSTWGGNFESRVRYPGPTQNLLADGSFEEGDYIDAIMRTGLTLSWSFDTGSPRTGTYNLQASMTGGATDQGFIMARILPGQRFHGRAYFRGDTSTDHSVAFGFCAFDWTDTEANRGNVKQETVYTAIINQGGSPDWELVETGSGNQGCPHWATHCFFRASGPTSTTWDVDDVELCLL